MEINCCLSSLVTKNINDDLVLVTRNGKEFKQLLERLEKKTREVGSYINESQIKYMEWTDKAFKIGKYLKIMRESRHIQVRGGEEVYIHYLQDNRVYMT